MATKYGEATLAVKYRVKAKDGSFIGGPMYALERGLGHKWLECSVRNLYRYRLLRYR